MSEPEFLHELGVEVEADLELQAAGTPPEGEAWPLAAPVRCGAC
ncbi:hypothetical protein ACFV9C_32365 [Kribbella sp. NPDC059898]